MKDITLKDLLEAGCHFGHQSNRWHPKAKQFIYTERDGVHIIDLVKTLDCLHKASEYLKAVAVSGGTVLVVGTKRQAQQIIGECAKKVLDSIPTGGGFYFLTEHWPGGMLTNFDTIKKNNLDMIVSLKRDIDANNFVTKKEKLLAQRKHDRYAKVFSGAVGLQKRPSVLFVVDVKREAGAVKEANSVGVPVVAMVDTNSDPVGVSYPVPTNDDASGSIKIICDYLTGSWIEGKKEFGNKAVEETEVKKAN